MSNTSGPSPPTAAELKRWDTFVVVIVPISSLVIAIATVFITYQISRISDLASDIKNVNSRVDQIYPLIAQSTADLGYLKGSLEATTQKMGATAAKEDELTKRLELVIGDQEAQSKNMQDIARSLAQLSTVMISQQHQIEEINSKLAAFLK